MNLSKFKSFYLETVLTLVGFRCKAISHVQRQNASVKMVPQFFNIDDQMLDNMFLAYASSLLSKRVLDANSDKKAPSQAAVVFSNPSIVVNGNLVQNIYIGNAPSQEIKCENRQMKCVKESIINETESAYSEQTSSTQALMSSRLATTTEWPTMVTIDQVAISNVPSEDKDEDIDYILTTQFSHHTITSTPSTIQHTPTSKGPNSSVTQSTLVNWLPSTLNELFSSPHAHNGTSLPTTAAISVSLPPKDPVWANSARNVLRTGSVSLDYEPNKRSTSTMRPTEGIAKSMTTWSTLGTKTTTKVMFSSSSKVSSSRKQSLALKRYSSPMAKWSRVEWSRTSTTGRPVHAVPSTSRPSRLRPHRASLLPLATSTDRQFSFLIRSPYDYFLLKKQVFEKKKQLLGEKIASLIFPSSKFRYKL